MDLFALKKIAFGLSTWAPGVLQLRRWILRSKTGAYSARYCYSVWLRHLSVIYECGVNPLRETIAELGPGGSLGIGIAAMLTGSRRYWALDVQKDCNIQHNLEVLDQLVELFKERAEIPDENEFPEMNPKLKRYVFPSHILSEQRLAEALEPSRIDAIRECLASIEYSGQKNGLEIKYMVPWEEVDIECENTVDIVISQAVMEHVENIEHAYSSTFLWLKEGGIVSHQIDFRCHMSARLWNGHWAYSNLVWKLIKGRKPFMINRAPLSRHRECMESVGFRAIAVIPIVDRSGIARGQLAREFSDMSDEDLITRGAHIISLRP